jgi:hypothetical protein
VPVDYRVEGPFEVPFVRRGNVKNLLRADLQSCLGDFGAERGCYVFALRGSRGALMPFYVGKTARTFAAECFTDNKLVKYNEVLFNETHGTPVMLLVVAERSRRGAFNGKALSALEEYLIGLGLQANPEIKNIRGTRQFDPPFQIEKVHVPSQGRVSSSVMAFKKTFGIR